jgi:two-component system, chemotaxis family, chemotaxis protein CheY
MEQSRMALITRKQQINYHSEQGAPEEVLTMAGNNKISVLLIDDSEMTRSVLRTIIKGDTFDVVAEAKNGATGLERAYMLHPDIVCLDISMPDMGGIEVLKQIKSELTDTVVLMVTSSNDADTVQAAIDSGAAGFIIKPFVVATVQDMMRTAANKVREIRARQ